MFNQWKTLNNSALQQPEWKTRLRTKIPAGPAVTPLREVHDFGSNPGALRMFTYVPAGLAPGSALVVVLVVFLAFVR